MKTLRSFITAVLIIAYSSVAIAQLKSSPYEVGINAGVGLYNGDLTPTLLSPYKSPGIFLGISGSKKLSKAFALQADLSFGKLKADDANYSTPEYRQQRNFNFKTRVIELSVSAVFTPLERKAFIALLFCRCRIWFFKSEKRLQQS